MRKIAVALLLAWSSAATAAEPSRPAADADCTAAIASAERSVDIPAGLLMAFGQVESGRSDPIGGAVQPWPWTIDAGGAGRFFASQTEAMAATAALQGRGVASIDVGCLQVNLMHHPAAFATLEEAFDPLANALYAARFLRLLFSQTGDWSAAVAAYHSQTHEIGAGLRDRDRWSPGLDGKSAAWRPINPSVPSPWIDRVIGAVASCTMQIETPSPSRAAPAEAAPVWKESGRNCTASPFAKPAALRQLLAGAWSNQIRR